ncbi:MAG: hypothetical protein ACRDKG_12300 [Actinomycetota bacterium]
MRSRRFSPASLVFLSVALIIVAVAVGLATTSDIGVGWAVVALIGLYMVMIGYDARSRGMTILWGVVALSGIGLLFYAMRARDRSGTPRV